MCAKFIDRRRILFKTNGASPNPSVIDWFRRPLFKTNYVRTVLFLIVLNWLS